MLELGEGLVQDAIQYMVESWCKAFFRTDIQCDVMDNNMAEAFNGWILDARTKPIISMVDAIKVQMMNKIWNKSQSVSSWIMDVSPNALKKLEKNKERSYD